MALSAKKALLREVLIFFGIVSILVVSEKMGQISLSLPLHQFVSTRNDIPKYNVADKDKSMVLFETGEIFLFAKPPTRDEIAWAYMSQNKSQTNATYKVLYPTHTFINLWFFHLNPTFGFCDIEFDKLGAWFFMLAYPIYLMTRGMVWLHKEVMRGLNR